MLYQQECYEIVGVAMKVYNTLGPGFLEAVYHEALEIEFDKCKILFDSEKSIDIFYDGVCLKQKYRPDFFCMVSVSAFTYCHKKEGCVKSQILAQPIIN